VEVAKGREGKDAAAVNQRCGPGGRTVVQLARGGVTNRPAGCAGGGIEAVEDVLFVKEVSVGDDGRAVRDSNTRECLGVEGSDPNGGEWIGQFFRQPWSEAVTVGPPPLRPLAR